MWQVLYFKAATPELLSDEIYQKIATNAEFWIEFGAASEHQTQRDVHGVLWDKSYCKGSVKFENEKVQNYAKTS